MTTQTTTRTTQSANVIIALLVCSAFVMILNETIMSVALPVLIGVGVRVPMALVLSCAITALAYAGYLAAARSLGFDL